MKDTKNWPYRIVDGAKIQTQDKKTSYSFNKKEVHGAWSVEFYFLNKFSSFSSPHEVANTVDSTFCYESLDFNKKDFMQ